MHLKFKLALNLFSNIFMLCLSYITLKCVPKGEMINYQYQQFV